MPSLSNALRGALLSLVLVLAAPAAGAMAAAPAFPTPADPALMAKATAIGTAQWGAQACGGQVGITWEHLGRQTNAESRWAAPAGGGPDTYQQCRIAFSLDTNWDWPKFCTVVTHELGHLTGHAHTDDPANVMSAYYYDPIAACGAPATAKVAAPRKVKAKAKARTARSRVAKSRAARARSAR